MSKFFVGQMVRLVRPWVGLKTSEELSLWASIAGSEGRVCGLSTPNSFGQMGVEVSTSVRNVVMPEWGLEPISDLHTPCESEFKESMDKLLEGLPA